MRLSRRLDVLEGIAEEARIAPYRRMAAAYDVPLAELLAEADEVGEFVERLRVRGLSLDAILVRCADRWSIPLDALRRNVERLGVDPAPWPARGRAGTRTGAGSDTGPDLNRPATPSCPARP